MKIYGPSTGWFKLIRNKRLYCGEKMTYLSNFFFSLFILPLAVDTPSAFTANFILSNFFVLILKNGYDSCHTLPRSLQY